MKCMHSSTHFLPKWGSIAECFRLVPDNGIENPPVKDVCIIPCYS